MLERDANPGHAAVAEPRVSLENGAIRAGRLEIRPAEHAAVVDGRVLGLTVRELDLLDVLTRHSERILTREELYEAAWGADLRPDDRSVDVYVSRLRSKLAAAIPEMAFIHTHSGIGYRFSPQLRLAPLQ